MANWILDQICTKIMNKLLAKSSKVRQIWRNWNRWRKGWASGLHKPAQKQDPSWKSKQCRLAEARFHLRTSKIPCGSQRSHGVHKDPMGSSKMYKARWYWYFWAIGTCWLIWNRFLGIVPMVVFVCAQHRILPRYTYCPGSSVATFVFPLFPFTPFVKMQSPAS